MERGRIERANEGKEAIRNGKGYDGKEKKGKGDNIGEEVG